MRTSLVRSSWSRERFKSTTAAAPVADNTRGSHTSSTSRTARGASVPASAATCPGGMFEPVSLLTTASPDAPRATVSSRVVVVLPFVPETERDLPAGAQMFEQLRVDAQARPAAGHRSLPAPEPSRRCVDRTRRRAGETRPH